MSTAEWKEYLRELKTSSEAPDLQSFAERALLLSRAEEVLQSSEIEALSYELVPPRMDITTPPGDFLIYRGDYFKLRLILALQSTIPAALMKREVQEIGAIFCHDDDLDAVIITHNDENLTSLLIKPSDLRVLSEPKAFGKVIRGPLSAVLEDALKLRREAPGELKPLPEISERPFNTEAIITDLHLELATQFDRMKTKRYRRLRKKAANRATEEELTEIERLLTEALRSGQSPEADFIQSILDRYDQND